MQHTNAVISAAFSPDGLNFNCLASQAFAPGLLILNWCQIGAKKCQNFAHFPSLFFRVSRLSSWPEEPVFIRRGGIFRVATLTGFEPVLVRVLRCAKTDITRVEQAYKRHPG